MVVAQEPAGDTTHHVDVAGPDGVLQRIHTFSGNTANGDTLEVVFDLPLAGIQFVRITTTSTPSTVAWNEIRVFGP